MSGLLVNRVSVEGTCALWHQSVAASAISSWTRHRKGLSACEEAPAPEDDASRRCRGAQLCQVLPLLPTYTSAMRQRMDFCKANTLLHSAWVL
jgi:hypothetical protein